jgi:uncharacterized protein YjbJ (UPF0337 family)
MQGSNSVTRRALDQRPTAKRDHRAKEGPRLAHLSLHTRGEQMADDLGREGAKDQLKGRLKEGEGRLRDAVGGLTGDEAEQLKGKAQQVKGKLQRKIGEAESEADRDL